jgi:hypothetical protein
MCIFIALWLWLKYGGKFILILHPYPHALVISDGIVRHGNKKTGKWKIYEMDKEVFARWIMRKV